MEEGVRETLSLVGDQHGTTLTTGRRGGNLWAWAWAWVCGEVVCGNV